MGSFETVWTSPVGWVVAQLQRLPAAPLRRAVVLVAAERQAHALRRHVCVELERPQDLAGVRLLRPADFATELLLRAGRVRRPGWEEVRRWRILQLFESAALGARLRYFNAAQLRSGKGYGEAFARTIADLEAGGLDAHSALALAERSAAHDALAAARLHDVAVTWQAADAAATPAATSAQLLAEATELLLGDPALASPFGPLFAMLAASPTTRLLRFLGALPDCRVVFQEARPQRSGAQRWREQIALRCSAPATPSAVTAASPSELALVQRYVFEIPEVLTDRRRPRSAGADGTVDVEEYAGIEDEIEAAAIWVTERITAGVLAEQIALIVPDARPYAALLSDRLARTTRPRQASVAGPCGLGVYVAGGLPLADAPAGRRLCGLLHAVACGLEAEATLRVLPALRHENEGRGDGATRLSPSRAARLVYDAGIVGGSAGDWDGASEWVPRLERRRAALRALVGEVEPPAADEPEKRRHMIDRQQSQRWLKDIERLLPAVRALQAATERILAGAPLGVAWQELRGLCVRWLRLPPDPPNLLALLDPAVQAVADDPVAGRVTGLAAVRALLDLVRRGRRPIGRFGEPRIFIGTASQAAGLPFAAVRVLGVVEGGCPHTPHDDPIIPDTLRQRIEAELRRVPLPGALPPGAVPPGAVPPGAPCDMVIPRLADQVLDEIHEVFRVISAAGEWLALSAPRQWVDRSEREVSGILLEVSTALGRQGEGPREEGDVPTAARLRTAYLDVGRAVRRAAARAAPLSPRSVLSTAPSFDGQLLRVPAQWVENGALALERVCELTAARESVQLGAMDGLVASAWSGLDAPGVSAQRPVSASGLTRLLECPHRFLLERILYLGEPARRPSTDIIEPLAYGVLFHAAAEEFFRAHGAAFCRGDGGLEGWIGVAQRLAAERFEQLRPEYALRGDGVVHERERLLRQIEQLVRYEWHLPPRRFVATELVFGEPEPVAVRLDDGPLYVRGAIDRVDGIGPQELAVRDLKTGRVAALAEQPMTPVRDLQIGLYVLALEAGGDVAPARAARAAYVHPSPAQEPDRAFEGAELERLRGQVREWLGIARRLLSDGAFPRTPDAHDCRYCPFVPACGEGAQQRSAAKLSQGSAGDALAAFLRLKREGADHDG